MLAILSFTLNRVCTEWYRNSGYDFTITSSTAYDQKWSFGRTTFESIDQVVEEIFTAYPAMPSIAVDGIYGEATKNAVRTFQSIFGLPVTGITDYPTWFKISELFVAVSKIAERI